MVIVVMVMVMVIVIVVMVMVMVVVVVVVVVVMVIIIILKLLPSVATYQLCTHTSHLTPTHPQSSHPHIHIHISSHLTPHTHTFSKHTPSHSHLTPTHLTPAHSHPHTLTGEDDSRVIGHFHPDTSVLTATIRSGKDYFYIEPSYRHINESHDFHMIAYHQSHVKFNLTG